MLPVVTIIGLSLGALLGGAILTETIFNLTGVGKTVFDAITARDYTVVQGFTLIVAVGFVVVNMVVDILYTYLDPRGCDAVPTIDRSRVRRSKPVGPVERPARGLWRNACRELLRKKSAVVGCVHAGAPALRGRLRPVARPVRPQRCALQRRERQAQRGPVHPPLRVRSRTPAAHPRHRRQRARSVQPDRLRLPHLAAGRRRGGEFRRHRRHPPRSGRRLLRGVDRQRSSCD